jgi:rod shape-determining protein MreD
MRVIPYLLYLLLIAFYRTMLGDFVAVGSARISLAALIVLLIALRKTTVTAIWFGAAAGIVWDTPDPHFLGVQTLFLSLIGYLASVAKERLNLESINSRLLLVAAGLAAYGLLNSVIYAQPTQSGYFTTLVTIILPGIVYTIVAAWVYFLVESGRISWARIKSIF